MPCVREGGELVVKVLIRIFRDEVTVSSWEEVRIALEVGC